MDLYIKFIFVFLHIVCFVPPSIEMMYNRNKNFKDKC